MLIEFAGQRMELHGSGALYWADQRMLVFSDLHFEKGSSFLKRRIFLPPYDTAETLARVELLVGHYKPERILLLGDVFHDARALARMSAADRARFEELLGHDRVIWVEGNHDAGTSGRQFLDSHIQGNIIFRHIAGVGNHFEISGHYHPAATIRHKGQKVRAPCFVVTETRLLMPSFGAYTGGLDVVDPALAGFMTEETRIFMLGQDRVYAAPLDKIGRP